MGRYNTCIATCSEADPLSDELEDWKLKSERALATTSEQEGIDPQSDLRFAMTGAGFKAAQEAMRGLRWAAADERASACPEEVSNDPQQLVDYLTEPFLEESQRHRVLFTWMVKNFKYGLPYSRSNRVKYDPGDILRQRSGKCCHFTELYTVLAELAGLPCGIEHESQTHKWNRIVIDGYIYPMDVTWGWYQTCSEKIMLSSCHNSIPTLPFYWMTEPLPGDPYGLAVKPHTYMVGGEQEYLYHAPTQLPPAVVSCGNLNVGWDREWTSGISAYKAAKRRLLGC